MAHRQWRNGYKSERIFSLFKKSSRDTHGALICYQKVPERPRGPMPIVSASPVHATAKRPQTGPIWTDLDRTASCQLRTFQIERLRLPNRFKPVLDATGPLQGKTVRLQDSPSKYLPNEPKNVEND